MQENLNYEPTREEKLASFKTEKTIKDQLKVIIFFFKQYFEKCEDEEMTKSYFKTQLKKCIRESLN